MEQLASIHHQLPEAKILNCNPSNDVEDTLSREDQVPVTSVFTAPALHERPDEQHLGHSDGTVEHISHHNEMPEEQNLSDGRRVGEANPSDSEKTDDGELTGDDEEHTGDAKSTEITSNILTIFEFQGEDLVQTRQLELKDYFSKADLDGLTSDDEEEFRCQACKKTYTSWTGYCEHLKGHYQIGTTCQICDKSFLNNTHLLRHIRSFHNKERPFLCRFCGKGFSTEWYCQKHEGHHENGTGPRIIARGRVYKCQFCPKVFRKPRLRQMHESIHTGEKSFDCKHCKKTFCYSSSLLKHLKSIHAENPDTVCPYCDLVFSSHESLFKHQEFHVGVNQFKCKDCNAIFSQMIALKRHRRTHHFDLVSRPFKCSFCEKCFTHKSMLQVHERTHTGWKPYSCPQCKKCFTQKGHLTTHLRSHSGDRPFSCSICHKSFSDQDTLQKHEQGHREEKAFHCPYCLKEFPSKHLMNRHLKKHETEQQSSIISMGLSLGNDTSVDNASQLIVAALQNISQGLFEVPSQGGDESGGIVPSSGSVIVAQNQTIADLPDNTQEALLENQNLEIGIRENIQQSKHMFGGHLTNEQIALHLATSQEDASRFGQSSGQEHMNILSSHSAEKQISSRDSSKVLDISNIVVTDSDCTQQAFSQPATSIDSVLQDATASLVNDYSRNVPVDLISPSIIKNPNKEGVRNKSQEQPIRKKELTIVSNVDDEGISVSADEKNAAMSSKKCAANGEEKSNRAEDSESTDDDCFEKDEGEKVFESINIFELSGPSLVRRGKIDMFEPKFHKKCRFCNKSFFSQFGLDMHEERHTPGEKERPYICSFCGRKFSVKASLRAHEAIHTGDSLYKCKECPKEFRNYSTYRVHRAVHTGEKPFTCEYCGQSFSQLAHVQRHERSHTGERPYGCTYCKKSFAEWGTWQRHIRTHTGEKPYHCQICNKKFSVKFALRRHMSTHKGENIGNIAIPPKDPRRPKGGRLGNNPPSEGIEEALPVSLGLQSDISCEEIKKNFADSSDKYALHPDSGGGVEMEA